MTIETEGLFTLLLFAVVFFVMMRYGCGPHMMHGDHGTRSHGSDAEVDPVCKGDATLYSRLLSVDCEADTAIRAPFVVAAFR